MSPSWSPTWIAPTSACARQGWSTCRRVAQRLPDWNPEAGGIRAFYFRDPDRHVLEVILVPYSAAWTTSAAPTIATAIPATTIPRDMSASAFG